MCLCVSACVYLCLSDYLFSTTFPFFDFVFVLIPSCFSYLLSINNNRHLSLVLTQSWSRGCTHAISLSHTSSNIRYSRNSSQAHTHTHKHTSTQCLAPSYCIDLKVISFGVYQASVGFHTNTHTCKRTDSAHGLMGWLCLRFNMNWTTTNKHTQARALAQYLRLSVMTVVNRATTIVLFSNKRNIMV